MVVKKNTCHPQKVKQEWSAVKFNFVHSKPYFCGRHELDHSKPFLRGGLSSFAGRPMPLASLGHSRSARFYMPIHNIVYLRTCLAQLTIAFFAKHLFLK